MVTEVGEIMTESTAFTVTGTVLDVATALTVSVTVRLTVWEPAEEGVYVHEEPVAPDTGLPSRYHR
jgi:hypothetical protein